MAHTPADEADAPLFCCPAAHFPHALHEQLPGAELNEPRPQTSHAETRPTRPLAVPVAHAVHDARPLPAPYLPHGQTPQSLSPPSSAKLPGAQSMHDVCPMEPWYLPEAHAWQCAAADVLSTPLPNVPTAHSMH